MSARLALVSCALLIGAGMAWALYAGRPVSVDQAKPVPAELPKPAEPPKVRIEVKPEPPAVATSAGPAYPARNVAPAVAAPEGDIILQREPARPPLSRLSLALPPKPDLAKGSKLFRPVAIESAVVESQGRRVAIARTESIASDVRCSHDGKDWPCGMRARTAFRLWLRGRALDCAVPDADERTMLVAACRLGKLDVGAWLVRNGWARCGGRTLCRRRGRSAARGQGHLRPAAKRGGAASGPGRDNRYAAS